MKTTIVSTIIFALLIAPIVGVTLQIRGNESSTASPMSTSAVPHEKIDAEILSSSEEIQTAIVLYDKNKESEVIKKIEEIPNVEIIRKYKIIPGLLIRGPKESIKDVAKNDGVLYIWKNRRAYILSEDIEEEASDWRNDYQKIRSMGSFYPMLNDSVKIIQANKLWDLGYNGSGIVIAILDTGIDKTHPDLDDLDDDPSTDDPKVIYEVSFVDFDFDGIPDEPPMDGHGHGTHCAGIAAGTGAASGGKYRGVAPGAYLMNVKVLSNWGYGYWDWIIQGIEYATFGEDGEPYTGDEADVISMSIGGFGTPWDPVSLAVDEAWDYGVVVAIAAGNEGPYYFTVTAPGIAKKVITVGAADKSGKIAFFSSRGPAYDLRMDPDILAPGVGIMSCVPYSLYGEYYQAWSGTSMATPHVAGAAALLLQAFPTASNDLIKVAMLSTAEDRGYGAYDQGVGLLNVYAAYNYLNEQYGVIEVSVPTTVEKVEIENDWYIVRFYSGVVSDYFYYKPTDDNNMFWEEMAVRYYDGTSVNFYWFSMLRVEVPLVMLFENATLKVAYTELSTPDNKLKLSVYIISKESKWLDLFIEISSYATIDWVVLYLAADLDMEDTYWSNIAEYLDEYDILYAYYEYAPEVYLGVSSVNASTAHTATYSYTAFYSVSEDSFDNSSYYEGDVGIAFKWNTTKISTGEVRYLITWAFGDNDSDMINNIQEGKKVDVLSILAGTPYKVILTKAIKYKIPVTTGIVQINASVLNFAKQVSETLYIDLYLDGTLADSVTLNSLNPLEEKEVSLGVTINTAGIHKLKVVLRNSTYNYSEVIRPLIVVDNYSLIVTPPQLTSPPLEIEYAGQKAIYTLTVLAGKLLDGVLITVNTPAGINASLSNNSFDILSGHEFIKIVINTSETLPNGEYYIELEFNYHSRVIYEYYIRLEITGVKPWSYDLSVHCREEEYFRVPNYNGKIEGDEDLSIYVYLDFTGTYYGYTILLVDINSTYVTVMDAIGQGGDDVDIYIQPNHPNATLEATIAILIQEDTGNSYGIPADFVVVDVPIYARVEGIPELKVENITIQETYGDDDGIIEPGEDAELTFNITNIGNGTAVMISVYAESTYGTVWPSSPGYSAFPAVDPGETADMEYPIYIYVSSEPDIPLDVIRVTIYYWNVSMSAYYVLEFNYTLILSMYEHDVGIILDAPEYGLIDSNVEIDIMVYNAGNSTETNVVVRLFIDDNEVYNTTIPQLENGSLITLACTWTPITTGEKALKATVEIASDENPDNNEDKAVIIIGNRFVYGPMVPIIGGYHALHGQTYSPDTGMVYLYMNMTYLEFVASDLVKILANFTQVTSGEKDSVVGYIYVNTTNRLITDYEGITASGYYGGMVPIDIMIGDLVALGDTFGLVISEEEVSYKDTTLDAWKIVARDPYGTFYGWYEKTTGMLVKYTYTAETYTYELSLYDTNMLTFGDLTVHISAEPTIFSQATSVNVNITVENKGDKTAYNINVTLYMNNKKVDSKIIDVMNPGDKESITMQIDIAEEGKYVLKATVTTESFYDESESDNTASINVFLDKTFPHITIKSPQNNSYIGTTKITISWSGEDALSGIDHYEIRIDGGNWIDKGTQTSHTLENLTEGKHTVEIKAVDKAGNYGVATLIFYVDLTPPTITITSPTNASYINSADVTVSWSGEDALSGIDHYEIRIDGGNWTNVGLNTSYTFTGLSNGQHIVDIKAIDKVGHEAIVRCVFIVDTIAPEITIQYPINGSELTEGTIVINWTATDNIGIQEYCVYVNDELKATLTPDITSYEIKLKAGTYTIKVVVVDLAGNTAYDEITIKVKAAGIIPQMTPETTFAVTIAAIGIISIIAVVIYIRRR